MSEEADDELKVMPEDTKDAEPISGDMLLNLLVHLAHLGADAGITVYTSGLIFSGMLTSQKSYFEESAEVMKNTPFRGAFDELLKAVPDSRDPDAPTPDYVYVYLKDCQVFSPGQQPLPSRGTLVRLLRSEIVGWSMGQLKAS